MSFIIFVPEWAEEKETKEDSSEAEIQCKWIKRLEISRWNRHKLTMPAFEHEFRHAAQHLLPK